MNTTSPSAGLNWKRCFLPLILGLILVPPLSAQPSDPYAAVLRYEWRDAKTVPAAIEAEIRSASPEQLRAIESKLLNILQSAEATTAAKAWTCRTLRMAGSDRSIPALANLLTDKDLSADALFALRSIPSLKVDEALRTALPKVSGLQKAGIIQTLGARKDRQSVSLIAPFASDSDPAISEAALYALGQVGGDDALKALQSAKVADNLQRYHKYALLLCAESLAIEGKSAEAFAACNLAFSQSTEIVIKIAALRGLILADKAKAAPVVIAALKSEDSKLKGSAAKFACESGDATLINAVFKELSSFPASIQTMLLDLANIPAALPAARTAMRSQSQEVRLAAIGQVGRFGEAGDVVLLLEAAAAGSPVEQAAARKSLQLLRPAETDTRLVGLVQAGNTQVRAEAIRALSARNVTSAVPTLLALAAAPDKPVRTEALNALGNLAPAQALPDLLTLLSKSQAAGDRSDVESAILEVIQRAADKEAVADFLIANLKAQNRELQCARLRLLGHVTSPKSLAALREALKNSDPTIQDAAARALSDWPDPVVLPDLLAIARTSENQTRKVLALRGYIRLASLRSSRSPAETAQLLEQALALAPSANEKKLVLAAVAQVPHQNALQLAMTCLADRDVELEAASAVVQIAKSIRKDNRAQASAALQKVIDTCQSPAARQLAQSAITIVDSMVNIAPRGTASSPDGWEKDGAAGGDQAAIDDNPETYWDEEDGKPLYRYVVTFKQPEKIAAISILGYRHHNFAPKDFEILCDNRPVKKVTNAQYDNNFLAVPITELTCRSVELKITGYYGGSPAIREFGIYAPGGTLPSTGKPQ